jgi:hypothetical protein
VVQLQEVQEGPKALEVLLGQLVPQAQGLVQEEDLQ